MPTAVQWWSVAVLLSRYWRGTEYILLQNGFNICLLSTRTSLIHQQRDWVEISALHVNQTRLGPTALEPMDILVPLSLHLHSSTIKVLTYKYQQQSFTCSIPLGTTSPVLSPGMGWAVMQQLMLLPHTISDPLSILFSSAVCVELVCFFLAVWVFVGCSGLSLYQYHRIGKLIDCYEISHCLGV